MGLVNLLSGIESFIDRKIMNTAIINKLKDLKPLLSEEVTKDRDMKILVTATAGFIGHALVKILRPLRHSK